MRILITTDAFPPGGGGSGQSAAALSRALARRGHQVSVVVAKRNVHGDTKRLWHDIPVHEVGVGSRGIGEFQRRARVASFLKTFAPAGRFDVAHAQHWLSAKATVDARGTAACPVVVTVRDYWPSCIWSTRLSGHRRCPGCSYMRRVLCVGRRRPWLWPATPFLPPLVGMEIRRRVRALRQASAVIAVSGHVARSLPVGQSVVIPNLIDIADIETRLATAVTPEVPDEYCLFVGKLEANKAPDRLLPILRAAGVRLPLVVAGEGSLEGALRREAARSGHCVQFLGWVSEDQVLGLMKRAKAVLFPSRWEEPLSRVLLEALTVGAVLVVEPTGGTEETVVDGESGLLGRSVDELGRALARVSTDADLARRLRDGAVRRAQEVFSEEAVVPRVEGLYERVVRGEGFGQ